MFDDDEAETAPRTAIIPGEDLDGFSLESLAERRKILQDEIKRIDAAEKKKRSGRDEAEAVFNL